jgi:hypothetical protein
MDTARLLTFRLADLLRREHGSMADFLLALADFDRERRWEDLGYASLFDFLHRELHVSRGAAFYRSSAARLIQAYPEVAGAFRDGRLCITSVAELAKVLTPENRADVLPRFFHASKREAAAIAAELRPVPVPPRRDVVTALVPTATPTPTPTATPTATATATPTATATEEGPIPAAVVQPVGLGVAAIAARRRDDVAALGAELCRLHITVSRAFVDKLEAARHALSHARPGATTEDVLDAALDLVLAARDRRRGLLKRPCDASPNHATQPAEAPTPSKEPLAGAAESKPRRRPARGLAPGRRLLPVGARVPGHLRLAASPRARSHQTEGARREFNSRQPEVALPRAQSRRRAARVWARVDGPVHARTRARRAVRARFGSRSKRGPRDAPRGFNRLNGRHAAPEAPRGPPRATG